MMIPNSGVVAIAGFVAWCCLPASLTSTLALSPSGSRAGKIQATTPRGVSLSSPPVDYYHDALVSPLARLAARHATSGTPFPPTLSARDLDPTVDRDLSQTAEESPTKAATFAGGCFWSLQLAYDRTPGVLATCVGYAGGLGRDVASHYPTYADVCAETTGHAEACLVVYDPAVVTYARLAAVMFDRIPDPTMVNRVGKDRGSQYRTGLFVHAEGEMGGARQAYAVENRMWKSSGREVTTEVTSMTGTPTEMDDGPLLFWPAEEGHQRYLAKGGSYGRPQSDAVGCTDEVRCYG